MALKKGFLDEKDRQTDRQKERKKQRKERGIMQGNAMIRNQWIYCALTTLARVGFLRIATSWSTPDPEATSRNDICRYGRCR